MVHDFTKFPELRNSQMQFYYFQSPHRQITEDFNATVIKVTDGDTVRVNWLERDFDFPVRMAFIAAPEKKEEGGKASTEWLAEQILGKDVIIEVDTRNRVGKFGRLIGKIIHNGVDLNQASLDLGFSKPFGEEDPMVIPEFEVRV